MRQKLQILYEDPDIIVCFKPHGLATQSHRISTPDLEHMILNHLAETEHSSSSHKHRSAPYLAVVHRLDQPVSGILVFAKNPKAARNLNHQLTNEGFGKHYMALVDGCPSKETDTLVNYLVKDSKSNTSRVCDHHTHGAKEARLSYRIHSREAEQTLLEVTLDTGRHHQIRVQFSPYGLPDRRRRQIQSKCAEKRMAGNQALCIQTRVPPSDHRNSTGISGAIFISC